MRWLTLVALFFVIFPSKVSSFLQLNGQHQIFTKDANQFVDRLNLVEAEICLENWAALSDKSFFYSNMTFKEVLSKWQYLNGLQDLGVLDYETMLLMTSTNCKPKRLLPSTSIQYINLTTDETSMLTKNKKHNRNKRYIKTRKDVKWNTNQITYSIKRFPTYFSRRKIEGLLSRAFARWADVSILRFTKVDGADDGNIKINFNVWEDYQHLQHQKDNYKNLFASAYLPKDGEIFIYEDNLIRCSENHVVVVMINVIGHALGLFLSDEEESLMYPVYSEQMNNLQFFGDEIEAIERLYGSRRNKFEEICNRHRQYSIDAAFYNSRESLVYIFQGDYFYTFDDNGQEQEKRAIRSFWKDVTVPISGAVYSNASGRTYLFESKTFFWYFTCKNLNTE